MSQVLENIGAGEGNRTLVISLEGCCSTIELHPRLARLSAILSKISGIAQEPERQETATRCRASSTPRRANGSIAADWTRLAEAYHHIAGGLTALADEVPHIEVAEANVRLHCCEAHRLHAGKAQGQACRQRRPALGIG